MREQLPNGLVALAAPLLAENSVALDSVMRLTGQTEESALNQAVKLYAAIASVAADPRNPTIGIVADPATAAEREPLGRRAWRRLTGRNTLIQWLHVELIYRRPVCDEEHGGDDG